MKTLVIHPDDKTTLFLSAAYAGKDWTVMTNNKCPKSLLMIHLGQIMVVTNLLTLI